MEEKYAKVKVSDLKKAYDEGCEDVHRTLRKMYPDILKPYCCDWMKKEYRRGFIKDGKKCRFVFSNEGEFYTTAINIMHYCPRCGHKFE